MCPWNRVKSTTQVNAQKKSYSSNKSHAPVVTSQPRHSHGGNSKGKADVEGGYIQRVTYDDREDEMNENLGSVNYFCASVIAIYRYIAIYS